MSFTRLGEDTVFDSIPLSEIKGVEKIDGSALVGDSFLQINSSAKTSRTNGIAMLLLLAPHALTFSCLGQIRIR